ncbi:MAG: hypothetical protein EON88_27145, partial [Brevundimonas sp.]
MRLHHSLLALAAVLTALTLPGAALAQMAPVTGPNQPLPGTIRPGTTGDNARDNVVDRMAETDRAARTSVPRRRGRPNPAEISAGAQAAVTAAGLQCRMTGATAAGQAGTDAVYEVACADAPGQFIVASTPPQAFNCLALDVSVAAGGDPSTQCSMPANKDAVAAMKGYAQALSVGCSVDQAVWVGRLASGADRYEV